MGLCFKYWKAVDLLARSYMPNFTVLNLLKPSGNFTYHQVQHSRILHCAHIAFMCFVWISDKTASLPYTSLTDWFL
jgi:hypothetical protein